MGVVVCAEAEYPTALGYNATMYEYQSVIRCMRCSLQLSLVRYLESDNAITAISDAI